MTAASTPASGVVSAAPPPGPRPPGQTPSPRVPARTTAPAQFDRSGSAVALQLTQAAAAELERKRRLVRAVPLLVQLVKEQHCSEDELLAALRLATFSDGEYIFRQGQTDKDLYFIEEGRVLLTQRRTIPPPIATVSAVVTTATATASSSAAAAVGGVGTSQRRSVVDADLELQLHTHNALEYFGELSLLQDRPRKTNAIASGAVVCMTLGAADYAALLAPLHELLLYRHLLRAHCVLERQRLFKEFTPAQRQFLIDRVTLQRFAPGELICRQGESDDRFFILADGEANVVLNEVEVDKRSRTGSLLLPSPQLVQPPTAVESTGGGSPPSLPTIHERATTETVELKPGERYGTTVRSTVVAQKSLFQGFGEMGLLDKPRTADVVAVGHVLCLVLSRRVYLAAAQLHTTSSSALDNDAEEMLATTLIEEWNLVLNARNLHLSNPQVAHYLVTFIKKFKAAYNQKFVGRTMYLDLLRRVHQEPALGDEFEFLAARIAWDSPSSSLSIIRSETRRVLSLPPERRAAAETSFVARMIESTAFLSKFDVPAHVDRAKLARHLARVCEFWHVVKDQPLFRQGKIESRAFLILRGRINIVNEDVTASAANTTTSTSGAVKHYEVIATLAAGDSFGELSLVTRLQRSATAMAACDADLLVLDRDRLHLLQQALPGVSVQHLMVERAEFLARLSFFKGSDFGQCIRVAHDLHEVAYEPRHVFLQEPAHQRTLYIVKSGEIAVFVRRQVGKPLRQGLVRVASIGAQEFFGVAIATVNVGVQPATGTSASSATTTPSVLAPGTTWDLGTTVYMCTTRVVMLELSERGWRRLNTTCLQIIRSVLLERHHWHDELATRQKEPTFFHPERPWLQLPHALGAGYGCLCGCGGRCQSSDAAAKGSGNCGPIALLNRPSSNLARHVQRRKTHASPYAKFFPSESPRTAQDASEVLSTAVAAAVVDGKSPVPSSTSRQQWEPTTQIAMPSPLGGSFASHGSALPPTTPRFDMKGPKTLLTIASRSPERLRAKQEAHAQAEAERQRLAAAAKEMETRTQEITAMWRPSVSQQQRQRRASLF